MSIPNRVPPQDAFAAEFEQLIRDAEEIKKFQLGGEDSVRMYRIFSGSSFDKQLTNVQFNNKKFRLKFTPAAGAERGLVYKMEYTYTEASGSGISSVQILTERESVSLGDGSQTWVFVVQGSNFFPNPDVRIKFYFWASGEGTFTTTDL